MVVLIALVAIVGALCLLDLLLTFGVIRRLREHTSMLAAARGPEPAVIGLSPGESPAAFSAVTTCGQVVTAKTGLEVVAFFSTACAACPERVPAFVSYLSSHAIRRDAALAVIEHGEGPPPPYLDSVTAVAQACVESPGGDVATAFQVRGFPAFCVLDSTSRVLVTGYDPSVLSAPAAVTADAG